MRSEADILKAFEGLDTRPGSRHARVPSSSAAEKKRARVKGESNGWDANPLVRLVRGVETELFPIAALASALEKEVVTIRYWEKKGYIPGAPFRLRSKVINGKKVNGNRVYTRELVEIVIEEFSRRGLLGTVRIDWQRNGDMTDAITRRWKESTESMTASQPK
jgi:hypothetical protein